MKKSFVKKLYMVGLSVALVASVVGCGKKNKTADGSDVANESADSVQEEIISFVNVELPAIEADQASAIATYNSYFNDGNINVESFGNDLNNTAIPSMETFINNLTAIETKSDEVANLKNLYLQGAQKQYDAMVLAASAISEQDSDYLTQANDCIATADSYFVQYESQLRLLSIDFDFNIDGQVTSNSVTTPEATPADAGQVDSETVVE